MLWSQLKSTKHTRYTCKVQFPICSSHPHLSTIKYLNIITRPNATIDFHEEDKGGGKEGEATRGTKKV